LTYDHVNLEVPSTAKGVKFMKHINRIVWKKNRSLLFNFRFMIKAKDRSEKAMKKETGKIDVNPRSPIPC